MCKEYRHHSSAPDPSSYHLKMSEAQYYLHSLPLFTHGLEGFVQNAINECILQGRDRLIALFKRRASSMKFSAPKRCISLLDKRISKDIVGKWGRGSSESEYKIGWQPFVHCIYFSKSHLRSIITFCFRKAHASKHSGNGQLTSI